MVPWGLCLLVWFTFQAKSSNCPGETLSDTNIWGISNITLLNNTDYILLTIVEYNVQTYCKILNVNDGTISNVVSCNYIDNIREWPSYDDPTATSLLNVTDENNGKISIQLSRNGESIIINNLTSTLHDDASRIHYLLVDNSINSVIVILFKNGNSARSGEAIQIIFESVTNNTITNIHCEIPTSGLRLYGISGSVKTYSNSDIVEVKQCVFQFSYWFTLNCLFVVHSFLKYIIVIRLGFSQSNIT